jgi:hypothetical protein
MNRQLRVAAAFAAALTLAACVPATKELPERARTFAALPDWTGLWETTASSRLQASGVFVPPELWAAPPYNAEWAAKAGGRSAPTAADGPQPDLPPAIKVCTPSGFPAVMDFPVPDMLFEVLVTPEQALLVSSEGTIRHIYTDGLRHPADDELWPTPEGHSIGHWEADTLVIETVARTEGPVGPWPSAAVLSERARFREKLRLLDVDTLQNELTIEDPERLARPWNLVIRYVRVKNLERMIAVNCYENDRNPVVDGRFVIAPPN